MSRARRNLIGKVYNGHTVISEAGDTIVLRCRCGAERQVKRYRPRKSMAGCMKCSHIEQRLFLSGQTFFTRTVTADLDEKDERGTYYVLCVCSECGVEQKINNEGVRDAGCRCQQEITKGPGEKWEAYKHGRTNTPEYRAWADMRYAANNPNYRRYKFIGAKGIKVCERWANSFESFLADMGVKPEGFWLKRKDSKGDFTPENCVWTGCLGARPYMANDKGVVEHEAYHAVPPMPRPINNIPPKQAWRIKTPLQEAV